MQGDFMIFITAKFRLLPEHADNWPEICRGVYQGDSQRARLQVVRLVPQPGRPE